MPVVPLEYIEVDDRGVARLVGTRFKVRFIAGYARADRPVAEIQDSYPDLTLAQIHAALAYYYDHKAEIDAEIEEEARFVAESRAKNPNRLTRDQWRELWKARVPDRPFPGDEPAEGD